MGLGHNKEWLLQGHGRKNARKGEARRKAEGGASGKVEQEPGYGKGRRTCKRPPDI